jgi:hypothetical protein
MKLYKLLKTETYKVPKINQQPEVIFVGGYYDCMGYFHKKSPFSYHNHKWYSYTHFEIKPLEEMEIYIRKTESTPYSVFAHDGELLLKDSSKADIQRLAKNAEYTVIEVV